MSSNKPLEPNKTLVGIPGDFQAAVDKLRAQDTAAEDMQRTRMGNPQSGAQAAPPPLPPSRPFQPPAGFEPAPPPAPMHHPPSPGRLQPAERTILGMPNNLQEVLRAADAAVAQRAARGAPAPEPSTQRHGSAAAPPVRRGTGLAGASRPESRHDSRPDPRPEPRHESRVHLHLNGADDDGSAHAGDGPMYSTRSELDHDTHAHARSDAEEEDATDVVRRPRLALSERTTHRTTHPTRKLWPILAAVVAVVVLAGGGWLAARWIHADDAQIAQTPSAPVAPPSLPVAVQAQAADPARPNTTTDVSAATQADRSARPVPQAAPSAAPSAQPAQPAQPVTLGGTPAELERQAIELLIAKNYAAAAQAYERLRVVEPDNKAYAVMSGLLSRGESKSCGQPGQEPCATR